eukprot:3537258-Karenia_brevis.AAC.1
MAMRSFSTASWTRKTFSLETCAAGVQNWLSLWFFPSNTSRTLATSSKVIGSSTSPVRGSLYSTESVLISYTGALL